MQVTMGAPGRSLLVVLLFSLPFAALAAKLPIDASYGSKEGCIYAKTGESSGADDFLLMTPDDIRTSVGFCEYKSLVKTEGNTMTVILSCAAEGEDTNTDFQADFILTGKKTYDVKFADGTAWGPFKKCE